MRFNIIKTSLDRRSDIFLIVLVTLIYLFSSIPFYGNNYTVDFVDTGRELFIPFEMVLNKSLLYKDITNVYGPLSYQINACLLSAFGLNLNVLFIAGLISGWIVTVSLYLMARIYLSKSYSFYVIFCILFVLIVPIGRYILPYAYALSYATMFFYLGALFTLYFVKYEKLRYLYISNLFYGAMLITKFDYLISITVIGLFIVLYFNNKIKNALITLFSISVVPTLSIALLLFQGVKVSDFKESFLFMLNLMNAETLKPLYDMHGVFFETEYFLPKFFMVIVVIILVSIYVFAVTKTYVLAHRIIYILINCLLIFSLVLFIIQYGEVVLLWFCQVCTYVAFVFIIKDILTKNTLNRYSTKDIVLYLLLLVLSITSLTKGLFFMNSSFYIPFLFPLTVLTFFVLFKYLYFRYDHKLNGLPVSFLCLIFFTFCIFVFTHYIFEMYNSPRMKTPYGSIRTQQDTINRFGEVTEYLTSETNENDKVLFIPEGAVLNLLSNRATHNRLYTMFFPPYIESIGEKHLIQELNEGSIEYIVILRTPMDNYFKDNKTNVLFGKDYGLETMTYIDSNYTPNKLFTNSDKFEYAKVYKLNKL